MFYVPPWRQREEQKPSRQWLDQKSATTTTTRKTIVNILPLKLKCFLKLLKKNNPLLWILPNIVYNTLVPNKFNTVIGEGLQAASETCCHVSCHDKVVFVDVNQRVSMGRGIKMSKGRHFQCFHVHWTWRQPHWGRRTHNKICSCRRLRRSYLDAKSLWWVSECDVA